MEFIIFAFFTIIGWITGVFLYAQMLLPLIYSFPRSVYLVIKGELKFLAILFSLIPPILWCLTLILAGYILATLFSSSAVRAIATNPGLNWGSLLAMLTLIFNCFTSKGRDDMRHGYDANILEKFKR